MNGQGNPADMLGIGGVDYVAFVANNGTPNDPNGTASPTVTSLATTTSQLTNGQSTGHSNRRPAIRHQPRAIGGYNPPSPPPRASDPGMVARARTMLRRLGNRTLLSHQISDPGPSSREQAKITKPKRRSELILHHATKKVVLAIYDYNPNNEDDLTFRRGDFLEVLRDGYLWWFARHPDTEKVGYIPKNHVKPYAAIDDPPSEADEKFNFTIEGSGTGLAIAIDDYFAERRDELTCRVGDVFIVLNDKHSWWYVRYTKTQKDGFIHRSNLRPLESMEDETGNTFSI